MDARPLVQSPFSLLGFGSEVPGGAGEVGVGDPLLADYPVATTRAAPAASYGSAIAGYVESPEELLPVAALLLDAYA